jgi:membrane-associated protease RseP (regulator of RpoE activity)
VSANDPSSFSDPDGFSAGVFSRPGDRLWLHAGLFLATFLSMTFCGGLYFGWLSSPALYERLTDPRLLIEGLKFSIPLMTILFFHEMGHLVASRRHGLSATLPYFIPMPVPLPFSPGTLGAVIRVRDPIRSRRQLLDVGAAGPLAGFVVLVPILVFGLALSDTEELDPEAGAIYYFGEPLLFQAIARGLLFQNLGPTEDLFVHPTAWAAWFGLLVTALNMLPFSQLDGGHVCYALFGRWHRRFVWGLFVALVAIGFLWPGWWLWSVIIAILGPEHPPVYDEARPLDRRRMIIGWIAIAVFILSFTAVPIEIVFP